ncbi:MAG: MopE-related protein [Myxococcales bacterium]
MRGWGWVAVVGLGVSACNCGQRAGTDPELVFPCARDADCGPTEQCVNGVCQEFSLVFPDAGLGTCQVDGDCPDLRYACLSGTCSIVPGVCLTDADCVTGYQCNPSSHQCVLLGMLCDLEGTTRSCAGSDVGACRPGVQACAGGLWGPCVGTVGPTDERCDGEDNDCDGVTDEDFDLSSDPANCGACGQACRATNARAQCLAGRCVSWKCDPNWFDVNGDRLDGCEYACVPSGPEVCDGKDNDCNGKTDDGLGTTTCGVGACARKVANCVGGAEQRCRPGDPGIEECNGRDDNCDGEIDEKLGTTTCGVGACMRKVANCAGGTEQLCEPGAPGIEVCNGQDDDCDGETDEGLGTTTCGIGACERTVANCANGVAQACEPGAPTSELCNGLDDSCDGETDEGLGTTRCGVGACARTVPACSEGLAVSCEPGTPAAEACNGEDDDCDGDTDEDLGTTTCGTGQCARTVARCSDGKPQDCVPGAPALETCNGEDDDCDSQTDENVTFYSQDGSEQRVDPIIRPVDVVFVVANNGTMNEEIEAVEANINQNFAALMDQSGIDYRVIMVSKYGYGSSTGNYALCITPPLGGNATCSGTCPVNTARFYHYSVDVGAHDSLSLLLDTYAAPDTCGLAPGGWSQWLRPDAAKVFIEISDNGPTTGNPDQDNGITAAAFEERLFALAPETFGTSANREYRFHSIVGLAENEPASAAWLPTAPLVDSRCSGNGGFVQQPGLEYQKLSLRTQGLRYPICQYQSFDAIFSEVARKIVIESELSCGFTVSQVPGDSSLAETTMELVASDGSGGTALGHVGSAAECAGNAFYVEGGAFELCPDACLLWRSDPTASAEVTFRCHAATP